MSTNEKCGFGYLDPEYFRCLHLTGKSDIYYLGLVLLEVCYFGLVLLEVFCAKLAIKSPVSSEEDLEIVVDKVMMLFRYLQKERCVHEIL